MDLQVKNIATKYWVKSQDSIQKIIEDAILEYAKGKSFDNIPEDTKLKMRQEMASWVDSLEISYAQTESFHEDCPTIWRMMSPGEGFVIKSPEPFTPDWWWEVANKAWDNAEKNYEEIEEYSFSEENFLEDHKKYVERYQKIHKYCMKRIPEDWFDELPF